MTSEESRASVVRAVRESGLLKDDEVERFAEWIGVMSGQPEGTGSDAYLVLLLVRAGVQRELCLVEAGSSGARTVEMADKIVAALVGGFRSSQRYRDAAAGWKASS